LDRVGIFREILKGNDKFSFMNGKENMKENVKKPEIISGMKEKSAAPEPSVTASGVSKNQLYQKTCGMLPVTHKGSLIQEPYASLRFLISRQRSSAGLGGSSRVLITQLPR
jgi:hypothetical protein